jgi:AGCS family alanine or glycine:cation symporter
MQYLKDGISANLAKCYAFFGLLLMIAWSSAQANQLASILASPALQSISIPTVVTGIVVTLGTLYILVRGIKQIGDFSAKLVPAMFVIYVGAALWILALHIDLLPAAVALVFKSAFEPYTFASGAVVGGLAQALRWGVFKGVQSNEAGIGTQTIPHSMAENDIPADQGILSMVATYSAGFICILSGLVTLVTGTWQRPDLALGINMVAESFRMDFSYVGIVIVAISAFLFAFGTILGNSFNGSQCFGFLTNNKYSKIYFVITACGIFLGATSDVQVIWTMTDFFLAPLAVSHIAAIVYLSFTRKELLHTDQLKLEQPVATS